MKGISKILALAAILAVAACEKPEENGGGQVNASAPVLVSSDPADGTEDILGSALEVTLIFDKNVLCTTENQKNVTIDQGAVIDEIDAYMTEVTVSVSGLERGKTYTLTFPEGTLTDYSGNAAEQIILSFSTRPLVNQQIAQKLVTADPLPAAEKLYDYLLSIYGTSTLSGAMANVAWNTDEADWVGKYAGKYPAVAYFDYIHLASSPANWIDYRDITPASDWWNAGGLIGANWHWNVPRSSSEKDPNNFTCDAEDNEFSVTEALKEGTWQNEFMKESLKKISGYLKLLQDAGIPVIWRPLHEAAGNTYTYNTGAWFWWGGAGAQAYKDLWIYVFNYMKDEGLKNLIWVWTSQTSSYADIDSEFYPGDQYVDIIGRDTYNCTDASGMASQYEAITQTFTTKMAALSECGNVPDMAAQWSAGAKWLFFMPWYDSENDGTESFAHDHADMEWWKASFESDAVITRDELPDDLFN